MTCVCLERQFILLGFACCYLEKCFASFISIKVALIAFTMPILQVFVTSITKTGSSDENGTATFVATVIGGAINKEGIFNTAPIEITFYIRRI